MCWCVQMCGSWWEAGGWILAGRTLSPRPALALTYFAHRQAGLYLASTLPAALKNQGSHPQSQGLLGVPREGQKARKKTRPATGLPWPQVKGKRKSEKPSLPSSSAVASLLRNAHLAALPSLPTYQSGSLMPKKPAWVSREKWASLCLSLPQLLPPLPDFQLQLPCSLPAFCALPGPLPALSWALRGSFPNPRQS